MWARWVNKYLLKYRKAHPQWEPLIQFTEKNISQEETGKKNTNLNRYVSVPRTDGCTKQTGKRENMLMLSKKKKNSSYFGPGWSFLSSKMF